MKVTQVALSVKIVLDTEAMNDHAAASADVVGSELALQISEYARNSKLGYYPALDFFTDQPGIIDRDLLDAADNLSWLATRLVREEVRKRLRPLFAACVSMRCRTWPLLCRRSGPDSRMPSPV